ncbi:MAG: cytochrome P450 [Caldilineaceae bacterium]|nr:cytochrome P450 [Caldilineaceae bacterium]
MAEQTLFDLYSTTFKRDAYSIYEQLRSQGPVVKNIGLNGNGSLWFVTGYAEAEAVLRDHKRFVKNYHNTLTAQQRAQLPPMSRLTQLLDQHMLNLDGEDHLRQRALVNKAFSSRIINGLHERVQAIADGLLDQVQAQGTMNLIDDYAFPLPIVVIAEMLGIPAADRNRFRAWSDAFVTPAVNEEEWRRAEKLLIEFVDYLGQIFAERRQRPRQDLITALLQADEGGDKLSEEELHSMVVLLIVAGHETTVNLIGNGTLALLRHPAQMAQLKADPTLMPAAIEELLRYDGPVERATLRFAAVDAELAGQWIRRGEAVSVVLGGADRDPAHFAQPDQLDLTRENNRHLAFGYGVHYCVGAPLARMEGRIALNTLLQRLPNLRLAAPVETLAWRFNPILRGLQQLPVAWDVVSPAPPAV